MRRKRWVPVATAGWIIGLQVGEIASKYGGKLKVYSVFADRVGQGASNSTPYKINMMLYNQNALHCWPIGTRLAPFVACVWKVRGVHFQEKHSDGNLGAAEKAQVNRRCRKGDMQKVSRCVPPKYKVPPSKILYSVWLISWDFVSLVCKSEYRKGILQDVTGGMDQTSGECSLGQTIPI